MARMARMARATSSGVAVSTGIGLLLAFLAIRLIRTGGPGGFPVAGAPGTSPLSAPQLRHYHSGYDGQFVYRLALDPFTRVQTAHGITLDLPAYRQQRIATALLAHLLASLPGIDTALALVLVNAGAVAVAVIVGVRLAVGFGRTPWAGLVLAVPAAIPISLGRDLTEPLAWAAILVAILAVRRGAWLWVGLALTLAVLARETSLIVVGGLGVEWIYLIVRRRPGIAARAWLLLPVAVEGGWQLWVMHVWHSRLPILLGSNNTGTPFIGIITNFVFTDGTQRVDQVLDGTYLIERVVLVVLLATAGWLVASRRARIGLGLTVAWAAAAVVALTLQRWADDISFLRATYEGWALSVLVVLSARTRWTEIVLILAGSVSAGVGLIYAVRI
jgi:hypothetical protein